MATYDNKSINGSGLTYFWSTIKALILGWIAPKQDHQLTGTNDASKVLVTDGSKNIVTSSVTSTQLGYLGNVTSDVQTQIGNKQDKISWNGSGSGAYTNVVAGSNITLTGSSSGMTISSSCPGASDTVLGGVKLRGVAGGSLEGYYDYSVAVRNGNTGNNQDKLGISFASSTSNGVAKIFSDTTQSEAANAVTSTAGRTYGIQKNSSGQLVVNVPWTDTEYTLPTMTASTLGGAKTNVLSVNDMNDYVSSAIAIYSGTLQARKADGSNVGVAKLYTGVTQTSASATDGSLTVNGMTSYFAPLASPTLTGNPTATTATSSDNSTRIATTAFVQTVVQAAVSGANTFQGTINYQDSDTQHSELVQHGDFKAGEYWLVNTTGTIAGQACEAGDMVYCINTRSHTAGSAITTSDFAVVQKNLDFLTNSDIDAIIGSVA